MSKLKCSIDITVHYLNDTNEMLQAKRSALSFEGAQENLGKLERFFEDKDDYFIEEKVSHCCGTSMINENDGEGVCADCKEHCEAVNTE